jgi:septum site-determining protein MinD
MAKKTITFHSYKGGTGKTIIAANFAALCAQRGKDVCLLDLDFRAPSLHLLFKLKPTLWLNDFFNGECTISDVIYEVDAKMNGKLFVGPANPSSKAMRDMMKKDRKWEANALHLLFEAKKTILQDLKFDYLILDTSPGMHYSSANALAASNIIVLTMKRDEFDVEGTKELVTGFYKALGRQTMIILNKVLFGPLEEGSREDYDKLSKELHKQFGFPALGIIPCYCDVLMKGSEVVFSLQKREHPIVERISEIVDRIDKLEE